jgi:hypothetical protein
VPYHAQLICQDKEGLATFLPQIGLELRSGHLPLCPALILQLFSRNVYFCLCF